MATAAQRDESPVLLARAQPFALGRIVVNPATREVTRDGESEILEPRAMQVLVALAAAEGAVVSRDELVARCWDGRIVGDNAITGIMVQIRRLASEFAEGSFALETITKVGYRLIVADAAATALGASQPQGYANGAPATHADRQEIQPGSPQVGRRRFVMAGIATAIVGAVGWLGWSKMSGHRPPQQAVELFRRGDYAQRQGDADLSRQAVSFLEQAVAIDPLYSDAWGLLALAYRHLLEGFGEAEFASLSGRIRSAAGRALALDADNADAKVALALIDPFYQNWGRMESALHALAQEYPDHWLLQAQIGLLLYEVGRISEGIPHQQRVLQIDPFLPLGHMFLARALSFAGRLQEADAVLLQARTRWPAHLALWATRYSFLLFNGRPAAAAAFALDPDARPSGMPQEAIERRIELARAVETRDPVLVERAVGAARAEAAAAPLHAQFATSVLALFGRWDEVFSILERYYFVEPKPLGRYERRYTNALFAPAMSEAWDDPRFRRLLTRIGLEDYWRQSGSTPDFRRR